jgi:5-methylcytosine-specific restriction endonuclease McrA
MLTSLLGGHMDYAEYRQSPEWRKKAREAKSRAGWQCALCTGQELLEAHHRTYARLGRERISDLVVLCWKCHRKHHGTLDAARQKHERYQAMLPFTYHFPRGEELN